MCFIPSLCTPAKISSLLLGHPSQMPAIQPFCLADSLHTVLLLLDIFAFSNARHSPHLLGNVLNRRKKNAIAYFTEKQNKHHKDKTNFLFILVVEFLPR